MTRHDHRPPPATVHGMSIALAVFAAIPGLRAASPDSRAETISRLAEQPFHFEANRGQTDERFAFFARGRNCNFFVSGTEALLTLTKLELPAPTSRDERASAASGRTRITRQLRFEFVGAASDANVSGDGAMPARANYFLGSEATRWQENVSLFGRVRVGQIYPGVDLVYYGNERRLEYDFIVAPGADASSIAIRFTGADQIQINAQGELVFTLGRYELVQPKPVVYQTVGGTRKAIAGGYRLTDPQTVTFQLGDYNRALPLVIDPILSYSRYFGGTGSDIGWDLALSKTDSNVVYVAGETMSASLPKTIGTNFGGGTAFGGDVFVARFNLNAASANPEYFTYLGGSGDDGALAIAVDSDGNAYLTGYTTSTNFPNQNGIFTNLGGAAHPTLGIYPSDAFVTKLGPDGGVLYSTYLGGTTNDVGIGIAINSSRAVFVTGYTRSLDFPTNAAALIQTNAGGDDVFVTVVNPAGTALVYSTYLGGTNVDHGEGIAADDAGNAYVTGYTASTNFPTQNPLQPFLNNPGILATNHNEGAHDVFVTKLDPGGNNLLFSTFLGGSRHDDGYRITLDAENNIFVCGSSVSADFPITTTNLPRGVINAALADAFVAKYKSDGSTNYYTTQFGGFDVDQAWDLAVDGGGNAHVVGVTFSTDFPTVDTGELLRARNAGNADVFLSVLGPAGTNFVRSALLGGSAGDFGYGIELNSAGEDYLVGRTFSSDFPSLNPFASVPSGANDVFIAKTGNEPVLSIAPDNDGGVSLSWQGYGFQLQSNPNLSAPNVWLNVSGSPDFTNGVYRGTIHGTNQALFFRLRR